MGIRLLPTPVAVEPIDLDEAKASLRVEHNDEDELIATYMSAAREWVEYRVQQKLALQTWELVIDKFPTAEIKLPFVPVNEVVSIKYDDTNGDEQTVNSTTYELDDTSPTAWVFSDDPWPTTLDAFNSVRVRFVAGYDDTTLIPKPLIAAIILKLKELYDGEDNASALHALLTNYYKLVA